MTCKMTGRHESVTHLRTSKYYYSVHRGRKSAAWTTNRTSSTALNFKIINDLMLTAHAEHCASIMSWSCCGSLVLRAFPRQRHQSLCCLATLTSYSNSWYLHSANSRLRQRVAIPLGLTPHSTSYALTLCLRIAKDCYVLDASIQC